jgi:hypothetical protein
VERIAELMRGVVFKDVPAPTDELEQQKLAA